MEWLRNLFKFEILPKSEQVHLYDLTDWLLVQYHLQVEQGKLEPVFIHFQATLKERRWQLECLLDEWEKKVPREKREELLPLFQQTREVLELITFEKKPLLQVNTEALVGLHKVMTVVENSPFASDFSFLDEEVIINPLLKELVEMRAVCEDFEQKLTGAGLRTVEKLQNYAVKLEQTFELIKRHEKYVGQLKTRLAMAKAKKEEKAQEVNRLKDHPDYGAIRSREEKKQDLQRQLKILGSEINRYFGELRGFLQKYEGATFGYVDDPLAAFINDQGLQILHILNHLQATHPHLIFDAPRIRKWAQQLSSLQRELQPYKVPIINNDFVNVMNEATYRLDHFTRQVNRWSAELGDVQDELSTQKINLDRLRNTSQQVIKIGLDRIVEITDKQLAGRQL